MSLQQAFIGVKKELDNIELPVISGQIPTWLKGAYIKNGPALFSLNGKTCDHWFDGFAMLNRFSFEDGKGHYTNKYLKSKGYLEGKKHKSFRYPSFLTMPDYGLLRSLLMWFKQRESGHNNNINVTSIGGHYYALTESPGIIEFDINSLETVETIEFEDHIHGRLTTAHPHFDFDRHETINMDVVLGKNSKYCYYKIDGNVGTRTLIAEIPVHLPSYIHSFSITSNYIIHVDYPLVVFPLRLRFGNKPYIKCYKWKPELGTVFTVVDRKSGTVVAKKKYRPFFSFHHVNAFESEGHVIVDIAARSDASVIDYLYIDRLKGSSSREITGCCQITRFAIPIGDGEIEEKLLCNSNLEMPTINYKSCNGKPYQFVYGVGLNQNNANVLDISKVDTHSGSVLTWYEEGFYPGEPLFVPRNSPVSEDDGVLLSILSDFDQECSLLLILDAKTLTEIARLSVPQVIPLGFHGQFFTR